MYTLKDWTGAAARVGLPFLIVVALVAGACSGTTQQSVTQEQNLVNSQQDIYNRVQPVHLYDFSLQRQVLQDIYDNMNQKTQMWDVVTSYTGVVLFQCEAEGWPIPADAQLTNPQQVVGAYAGGNSTYGVGTVGQAEPNGIYTGATAGTYILCIRPDGQLSPVYTENNVSMFAFPVKVGADGAITDAGGAASVTMTVKPGNITAAPASPKP